MFYNNIALTRVLVYITFHKFFYIHILLESPKTRVVSRFLTPNYYKRGTSFSVTITKGGRRHKLTITKGGRNHVFNYYKRGTGLRFLFVVIYIFKLLRKGDELFLLINNVIFVL
jgi:hypothetical protein